MIFKVFSWVVLPIVLRNQSALPRKYSVVPTSMSRDSANMFDVYANHVGTKSHVLLSTTCILSLVATPVKFRADVAFFL